MAASTRSAAPGASPTRSCRASAPTGGEVFTYARVEEILLRHGRVRSVRGVRMADGSEIACDRVISDAGAMNTFAHLLPAPARAQTGYDALLKTVKPSIGHLGVYIGLKGTAAELGLPKTNFWIYPGNDYDGALDRFLADPHGAFPAVYISFPSAKDPDFERRHPGRSTIEIVAPAPYEIFEPWANTTWGKRGDDYEVLKHSLGERLLEHLYDKLPQLRGRIDYWEVSTPLSMQWFCGYGRGELYGLDHDPGAHEPGLAAAAYARARPVAHRAGRDVLRRDRRDDGRDGLRGCDRRRAEVGTRAEGRVRLKRPAGRRQPIPSARRSRCVPFTGGHQ